jgi:ACT domain-containing protein
MKAVITVIGKDTVGIIAAVSAKCAEFGVNIVDISQSVLREYFAMIMLVELDGMKTDFSAFSDELSALGEKTGLEIRAMHEKIFDTMHKV